MKIVETTTNETREEINKTNEITKEIVKDRLFTLVKRYYENYFNK
jgi:hypothetical protein